MRVAASVLLSAAILIMASAPGRAESAAGQETFTGQNCTSCHYTDGPAKEKTIDDQLAKKGPELFYAGSKFQRGWLEGWLQDPQPIRPLAYNSLTEANPGNHPKLAAADATNVADFLMTLTSDAVEAGVITPKRNPKGRQIFTKKMPCSGCHQYTARKKVTGGRSGPSLVDAGARLNPDWIYAYLKTPEIFKPVKAMPTFVGLLREKDMNDVAAFVANFKAK
jgi:mono/diheme cytochrome c family protein